MTLTATFRGTSLVGRQFGRLTVARLVGRPSGQKQAIWECRCSCGKTKQVRGHNLKSGGVRSCGCLAKEPVDHPDRRHYYLALVPAPATKGVSVVNTLTGSKGIRGNPIVLHEVDGSQIGQRSTDGYINATSMCAAVGKLFGHYAANASTREFLRELSGDIGIPISCNSPVMGIPISGLIVTLKGGRGPQGTWVHPDVAVHLAMWCSPKFAVAVSRWVREWMLSGHEMPRPRKQPAAAAELGWTEAREDGKGVRKDLCRVLAAGGIHNPEDFRNATADVSREVLGASPSEIRRARKLPKSAPLRDHLTRSENLALAFAEDVAMTRIEETGAKGESAIECAVSVAAAVGRVRRVKKQLALAAEPVSEPAGKSAFARMKAMLGEV